MGVTFPRWPDVVKFGRSKEDIPVCFKEIVEEYKKNQATCDLIFIVMGGKNPDIYGKMMFFVFLIWYRKIRRKGAPIIDGHLFRKIKKHLPQ